MPISLILTPFDYFQIRPSFAVTPNLILEPCPRPFLTARKPAFKRIVHQQNSIAVFFRFGTLLEASCHNGQVSINTGVGSMIAKCNHISQFTSAFPFNQLIFSYLPLVAIVVLLLFYADLVQLAKMLGFWRRSSARTINFQLATI